jgi:hypothetical protein
LGTRDVRGTSGSPWFVAFGSANFGIGAVNRVYCQPGCNIAGSIGPYLAGPYLNGQTVTDLLVNAYAANGK